MSNKIPWFENYFPKKIGITKQKLKTGVIYRLRYKDPTGYIHRPKGGTSLEEARRNAKETHRRLVRQEWNEAEKSQIIPFLQLQEDHEEQTEDRLIVQQAIAKFQKSLLRGASRDTAKNFRLLLKQLENLFSKVCPHKTYIDEINAEDIEEVLLTKKKEKFLRKGVLKSPEDIVIDNHLRMIRRLFKFLVGREYLVKNPALAVKYLCDGGKKSRDVVPEDNEVKRIYETLESVSRNHSSNRTPLKEIIYFLVESGARKSEVFAMEWQDIQGDFWVIKEKNCSDGFYFKPKSKKSYRKYFLTDDMKTILESLPKVSPFVFPKSQVRITSECPSKQNSSSGVARCCKCPLKRDRDQCEFRKVEYSRVQTIKTAWTNLRTKTNTIHITLHDLRRYHNDKLLDHGLSNEESGTLIGNSSEVNAAHYDAKRNSRLQDTATRKRKVIGRIAPKIS